MAATAYASTSDRITQRQTYETVRASLLADRATFDPHWRELGDYLLPRRTRFWPGDRNKGDRRNQNIIDSTARFSVRTLQSGLHAGLTSPARPWMRLTTPDPDLAERPAVKQWLHDVTNRMLVVFSQSNLYNTLPIAYGDMGVFGTAAMAVLEDSLDLFRCYSYPIGSYAIGLDRRGLASSFVRDYELSVEQLVTEFGRPNGEKDIQWARFSPTVKTLWDQGRTNTAVEICWLVTPNLDVDPARMDSRALPWKSCYFEKGRDTFGLPLRESGFRQFPLLVPRWDVTGEDVYGTDCPGMTALGDVKQLQMMTKRKGQAIEKMVNPPLTGPSTLRTQKVSSLPGDVTFDDVREGMKGLRPIYEVKPDLQYFALDIRDVQYRIQRAFYEDLFLMLANSDSSRGMQPITAREIDERHEEKLLALGPVLERTNDELLNPLVDRVYALMERAGLLPPPPPELNGVSLRVEYTSIMAQAQKLVGLGSVERFVQFSLGMAAVVPSVLDKIDPMQIIDDYAEGAGINPKIIRSNDDALAIGQQRAQAAQAQQQTEQMAQVTKSAQQLGQTPMTGDTALNRVIASAAGAA